MTGSAHEDGSEKRDKRVVVFPSTTPNDLRVKAYDSLRGLPVEELD